MDKPYKCPLCNHRTKEKSALEKHIRCIHTGEAPYRCTYCPQAFKIQSNLVRHLRAHTGTSRSSALDLPLLGEKPYVCKKCGTPYADKKNMDAHIFRDHLKMRQFQCQEPGCAAKFWRQDRYVLHCEKIHGFTPILPDEDVQWTYSELTNTGYMAFTLYILLNRALESSIMGDFFPTSTHFTLFSINIWIIYYVNFTVFSIYFSHGIFIRYLFQPLTMSSDEVDRSIQKNIPWSKLPEELKIILGNSQREYDKRVLDFSIKNQVRYKGSIVR